jgi:uncharacterized protein (TIGR03437 family)
MSLMKKLALVVVLLPSIAAAQTQSIAVRVAAVLANGVGGGTQGLYLKQVGGTVLASQQPAFPFDPGTASDLVTLLAAVQQLDSHAVNLTTQIVHYDNNAASCPNPPLPNGTESLSLALTELMWRSDNARSLALHNFFGLSKLNDLAASIGMKNTTLIQAPGCVTTPPAQMTLADAALLLDGVESGALTASKATFNGFLSGKPQATAEGTDASRIWAADIPAMIRQESPSGTTSAQQASFQSLMDLGYKTGSAIVCQSAGCINVVETVSLAGWARVPYCTPTGNGSHDFVFGEFIANAPDSSWSPGKTTAGDAALASARAELLREQIRFGLSSCYGKNPVLVDPAPGSVLPGRTVTFAWSAGTGWDGYRLDVGGGIGGADFGSIATTSPQAVVTNLPCDGRPVYVRLWAHAGGAFVNPADYTYTACTNGGPQMVSPPPGANLFSPSITFNWTAVAGADSYRLELGTKPAGNDIASTTVSGTSTTIDNVPTDGRLIFARIAAHTQAGFLTPNDYAYNNSFSQTPAIASVANAVSPTLGISGSCLVVVTGTNFGNSPQVFVATTPAAVVGTPTATQLMVLIPNVGVGATSMQILSNGLVSAPFPVTLAPTSPGLYNRVLDATGAVVSHPVKPGDALTIFAIGVGPAGTSGPELPIVVRVGATNLSATVTSIALSSPGIYQVNFLVPLGTPSGAAKLTVEVGGAASNALSIVIVGPAINGVLNAASFAQGAKVAPGSLVSVFGVSLATGDALGVYPSATLPGGGAITINGVSAPLFDVVASQAQINLLVPFETPAGGSVPVVVINSAGTSAPFLLDMAAAAPGIFRIPDPSNTRRSNAAVLVANTAWRVMPLSMAAALGIPQDCAASKVPVAAICGQPATPGDAIQIYATGLGRATANGNPLGNQLRTGDVAPANGSTLYKTVDTPIVKIGGIDAQVVFAGIAPGFAGLYQLNVVVPAGAPIGDDVPVIVTMGGASDQATIAIRSK